MVADCPTKAMRNDLFASDVPSNHWDFEQSDGDKRVTQRRQMLRVKQHLSSEGVAECEVD